MTNRLQCPVCGRRYEPGTLVCPKDGAALRADGTLAASAADERLASRAPAEVGTGSVLDGKYRLDELLGAGGMGTVFRATHLLIDRPVAVKVLNPQLVTDEAARERLRREARAAGRLRHANAVAVTDFGQTADDVIYIVMELLEGTTLRDLLVARGGAGLDPGFAVEIIGQCASAVAAAHEAGIIHRDLKPGNIFILERSRHAPVVKVLDFGIAKVAAPDADAGASSDNPTLTETGVMIGTPRYMSPEQCDGKPLTPASDVYSLGILLYEMLAGAPPFSGPTPLSVALKHSTEAPRSLREIAPGVPAELERVVLHALAKRPEDRPPDAGAFRRELAEVARAAGLSRASGFSLPTGEAGDEREAGGTVLTSENLAASKTVAVGRAPSQPHASRSDSSRRGAGANIGSSRVASTAIGANRPDLARLWRERPALVAGAAALALVVAVSIVAGMTRMWSRAGATEATEQKPTAADVRRAEDGDSASAAGGDSASATEPRTANDFYERGGKLFEQRDLTGAERDLRNALELQPDFPEAHNRLGRTLVEQGRFAAAVAEFERAVKGRGGDFAIANFNLGDALERSGDRRRAIEAYEAALANRGGNYPEASFEIGRIHFNRNRNDEAARSFRQTIEARGGPDPETHYYLGVALARARKFDEAETALRAAIEQRGGAYPEAFYALGVLYENTKRTAEAADAYETYLRQQPDTANRRQIENLLRRLRRDTTR